MPEITANATAQHAGPRGKLPAGLLLVLLILVLVFAFRDSLRWMVVEDWRKDEYNHCYLIPLIAAFLIATRARELAAVPWSGSIAGMALVLVGFLALLLGSMSSIFTVSQYGFIVAVWGCFVATWGWPAVKLIWPALLYLVFMVPMPDFLEVKLSANLQLLSTRFGVAVIRLADVPVYVEGNVIDLGNYQLAVAEACSGLRYLYPLSSFGFLCAVLFQAPLWQRAVVFLSAVPLTVLMNSVRIGMIGILVSFFGVEQAEGFLHDFEGWAVFMVCVAILFLEMAVLARLSGQRLLKSLRMDTPPLAELWSIFTTQGVRRAGVAAGALVLVGTVMMAAVDKRQDMIPSRASLATFPLVLGDWRGSEQTVDRDVLNTLKADDTIMAAYVRDDGEPVGLWMAYYSSQRGGRAVHSPATCLPGGGWQMQSLEPVEVPGVRADGGPLPVNRSIIAQGDDRQLVYYWFAQRGRVLTNEYLVKWFIFWDGLTMNRTDGALVRLITPVGEGPDGIEQADQRLQAFVRVLDPKLAYFLPPQSAVAQAAKTD
jgi:exosortase D (VPLPA-CTERM-specific)